MLKQSALNSTQTHLLSKTQSSSNDRKTFDIFLSARAASPLSEAPPRQLPLSALPRPGALSKCFQVDRTDNYPNHCKCLKGWFFLIKEIHSECMWNHCEPSCWGENWIHHNKTLSTVTKLTQAMQNKTCNTTSDHLWGKFNGLFLTQTPVLPVVLTPKVSQLTIALPNPLRGENLRPSPLPKAGMLGLFHRALIALDLHRLGILIFLKHLTSKN